MDIEKLAELRKISSYQMNMAQEYFKQRKIAGTAKVNLDLILTAYLPEIRKEKKNVGYELAIIMLCERSEPAKTYYKDWQEAEAKYKGLERLLDAYAGKISMEQSVMKRFSEGEKYGS